MKKRYILKYPVGRSRVRPDLVSYLEKSRSSYLVVSNAPWSVPLGWILVAHFVCALITVLAPAHLVRIPVSALARLEWVCILNLVLTSTWSRFVPVCMVCSTFCKCCEEYISIHIFKVFGRYPMVQLEATYRKCRYIYIAGPYCSVIDRWVLHLGYWPPVNNPSMAGL